MTDQRADVEWKPSGVPVSRQFDDPYYSLENGLAETRHVFLDGNDLPARFSDGFHIAELGFGTGLNFLVALDAWRGAGIDGRMRFTTFEAFPMKVFEMLDAGKVFPDLDWDIFGKADLGAPLPAFVGGPDFELRVVYGDARQTLPKWQGKADAWFLDGFSPAKNPELWDVGLLKAVGAATKAGGTCATYTAAGFVRRGLEVAGFDITRTPGFGRKRHMTRGAKL